MPKLFLYPIKGKGRCLFAGEAIANGSVIVTNPVLIYPRWQSAEMKMPLRSYPFTWDEEFDCIPLGVITLANHSEEPNAVARRKVGSLLIALFAIRDIKEGEEITYHYKVPLWFEPEPPADLNLKEIKNGTSSK